MSAKYDLPRSITLPAGQVLSHYWSYIRGLGPDYWQLQAWARAKKAKIRKIKVLPRSLRGKRDLRGMPYQPGDWIFCSVPQKELYQANLQEDRSFTYSPK
jgi:hypothetical protein